ncbi:MAG: DNA repair protein RadA [Bacteroidaceae bacterium]|nr:DNA repair protein RadA [Bacteroidaceae bacterium]
MAKEKTVYVCAQCGYESPKWQGRCPACGEWNTFKEMTVRTAKSAPAWGGHGGAEAKPIQLSSVSAEEEPRIDMHDQELNRVLGGGLVPGSLVLIGGEPGIGKSTLLLQTILGLTERRVLYASGEESERQIKLRADRVKAAVGENVYLLCETRIEQILTHCKNIQPELLVIDSIQTMSVEGVESSPGSITQIRESAAALLKYAKENAVPVLIVGHITKQGSIAGPKVLEHIVDAVLQFEGDRHYFYRILRSIKNRFGSTSELGIYEMRAEGLRPVDNPSELLLSQQKQELSGIAITAAIEGVRPFLIETQALVSTAAYGTPQRSATGFDLRRLNMLLAVLEKRVGFKLVQKDVFLNIAGGLRVADTAMDLSVIAAVLSSNVDTAIDSTTCMCGEVGLSGEIRPVSRIEQRIAEAQKLGFRRILVPENNVKGINLKLFHGIDIVPVARVEQALRELFG